MTEIFVAEEHSQLYDLWLERGARNLSVCHVDFHCDMRGLLIDRRLGQACFVDRRIPYVHRLDSGSYLAHAVMNGMVADLRWVHDDFGGRSYDYLHCVKYETDFSALPYRLLGNRELRPVNYAEQTFAEARRISGHRLGRHRLCRLRRRTYPAPDGGNPRARLRAGMHIPGPLARLLSSERAALRGVRCRTGKEILRAGVPAPLSSSGAAAGVVVLGLLLQSGPVHI